jgi:hypothetical protein
MVQKTMGGLLARSQDRAFPISPALIRGHSVIMATAAGSSSPRWCCMRSRAASREIKQAASRLHGSVKLRRSTRALGPVAALLF